MVRHYPIIFLLLLIFTYLDTAAQESALCKIVTEVAPPRPDLPPLTDDALHLFADSALIQEHEGISTFSGNVFLRRAEQLLFTPTLIYDRNKDVVSADQDFTLWDENFIVSGHRLQLHSNHQGEMNDAHYWLIGRRGRGKAEKVVQKDKETVYLEKASFTTCDPDNEIWRLESRKTTLDDSTATGTSRDVTIWVFGVPLFYSPYLSYPLDDKRRSGFLPPSAGSSDETGFELSIPYYLNLAPNYDATLTARLMSRRGPLLQTEFRYLTQTHGGTAKMEYLPYDTSRREDRLLLALKHEGDLSPRWHTNIDFSYASDDRYFEELGNDLSIASTTHLERRGDLTYRGEGWGLLARLQAFQTLDRNPEAQPYKRFPQLVFKTELPPRNRQLNLAGSAEFVRFDRDSGELASPVGNRLDFNSSVSYPWRTPGTFLVPKLSAHYTFYDLKNLEDAENSHPDRLLYNFTTDSGLFFERDLNLLDTPLMQTVEPRLFYQYTPYEDQSDIPIFDTFLYDLSFWQLFREQRFNGADRIGDANQLTLALTSRLLRQYNGIEHLRASIGQTYYFRDRLVTLPDDPIETEASSSLIAELASQLTEHWRGSATMRWNPHTQNTEYSVFRLRYLGSEERIFNISYRLREDSLEQTDFSGYWPLENHWKVMGRWNYSLQDRKDLEIFAGLEYGSCCWAVRAVARRFLNTDEGDYLHGFFLEFALKGLGGLGKKADVFLEQSIPGYHDQF